jgi:hypothetical protein
MLVISSAESQEELVASLDALFAQISRPRRADREVFGQFLDQLIKLLKRRRLTQQEIHSDILVDDPVFIGVPLSVGNSYDRNHKLIVNMTLYSDCREKLVELLGKLVEKGHFPATKKILLEYHFRNRESLWVDLNTGSNYRVLKSEIIRKVPDWLYQRFKTTPPYVTRQERVPEDAAREPVGIWEDYDRVNERWLVD